MLEKIIQQWQKALRLEAKEIKENGNHIYPLTNGKRMAVIGEDTYYLFQSPFELSLRDDIPIRLIHHEQEYDGQLISSLGTHLLVKIQASLGTTVHEAQLMSAPWELLLTLAERFDDVPRDKQKRIHALLSGKPAVKHPQNETMPSLKEAIYRAWYNKTTYIWGPPGTGKTYTLAHIVAEHYRRRKKVLVLSHSNAAVDVIMLEVAKIMEKEWKEGHIIRYGYSSTPAMLRHPTLLCNRYMESLEPSLVETKINPYNIANVEKERSEQKKERKKLEQNILDEAIVIGTTLTKITMDTSLAEKDFDLIIVDEASMAYVPQIAFATTYGKRIVVCGDFKQLPPIATADNKIVNHWLKEDIFHHAKIVQAVENDEEHPHLLLLKKQRRMHPTISAFTNHHVYDDKVSNHPSVKEKQAIADLAPFPGEAVSLVDIQRLPNVALQDVTTSDRFNIASALMTMELLHEAMKNGITSIGIVTPYKAQARLLSALIKENIETPKNIVAATVHTFQGSEKDMIFFDVVDSFPQIRPGVLFTNRDEERLINVAVTRARGKFIQVMDNKFAHARLSSSYTLAKLTKHTSKHTHTPVWKTDERKLFTLIANATKHILICTSSPSSLPPSIWSAIDRKGLLTTVVTPSKQAIPLQAFDYIERDTLLECVIVDYEEICYGGTTFAKGKTSVNLLLTYLDIQPGTRNVIHKQEVSFTRNRDMKLKDYVTTWITCPYCSSRCTATSFKGNFRLQCTHCGSILRMLENMLQAYIDYVGVSCHTCARPLQAEEEEKDVYAICYKCEKKTTLEQLS
ncbi:DEAD/DEAH box helicase [Priestia taiwanensis]|uniref:Disulfide oxidoreductase n=1 Tax=Priestia taiwanensis TaxID=1347902 RepID=A0A917AQT5_9BACI|nr:AAA domain-containing protein [Priestia taiwanensis]MBM7363174.1 DNA-directed RNA polymerase subunit RPC12/RpoP [Priestia taiwanensis]GGE68290.1 disulfide oxidoreductase [Priestia taiwanensis]